MSSCPEGYFSASMLVVFFGGGPMRRKNPER